jgi:hypothetical protein
MNIASQFMVILECIYVIPLIPQRVYILTYSYLHALASSFCHEVLIPYRILLNLFEVDFDVQSIDLIVILKQKESTGEKKEIIEQQLKVVSIRMYEREITLPVFPLRNI